MSEVERWWRDDSSIFDLRDAPPPCAEARTAEAKKEETSLIKNQPTPVGDVPLDNGQRVKPWLEDDPVGAAAHSLPASGTSTQATQVPKTAAAPPGSKKLVFRPQNASEARAAPIYRGQPAEPRGQRSAGLWAAVVILALALVAITWYGALVLRQNNISVAQLPGMNGLITGLGGRMDATEAKLRNLTNNWGNVQDHVAELDRKVGSNLRLAGKQAQTLVDRAKRKLKLQ